jgi:hypothetical protein
MGTAPCRVSRERRHDVLLREVVDRCREELEPYGFRLDDRGSTDEWKWARFYCSMRNAHNHDGKLVLLIAHARRDCVWLIDTRFIDAALKIETPCRRRVHRYDPEAESARVAHEVVEVIYSALAPVAA